MHGVKPLRPMGFKFKIVGLICASFMLWDCLRGEQVETIYYFIALLPALVILDVLVDFYLFWRKPKLGK